MINLVAERQVNNLDIFFAYTNEAADLYKIAKKEIKNINSSLKHVCDLQLSLTEWKSQIVSEPGMPESTVMKQLDFSHSDICLFVFRFRYGTPTGEINPDTGEGYKSGMEQEY